MFLEHFNAAVFPGFTDTKSQWCNRVLDKTLQALAGQSLLHGLLKAVAVMLFDQSEQVAQLARVPLDVPAADVALPLARFYVLEPAAGEARATRLRPRDALARLATHLFRIDPEDSGRLPAELALLERVAARVRVVRLEVPRRFDALGEVRAVIAADLAGD